MKAFEINMDRVRVSSFGGNFGTTTTYLIPTLRLRNWRMGSDLLSSHPGDQFCDSSLGPSVRWSAYADFSGSGGVSGSVRLVGFLRRSSFLRRCISSTKGMRAAFAGSRASRAAIA